MTINAVFKCGTVPILIADFVVTHTGNNEQHIVVPTFVEIDKLLPPEWQRQIGSASRKTFLASPNLLVAASGNMIAIKSVFDELGKRFSKAKPNLVSLKSVLSEIDDLRSLSCVLVGWIVENGELLSIRWDSLVYEKLEVGGEYYEGSGAEHFRDLAGWPNTLYPHPDHLFTHAAELCLHRLGTLYANELKYGSTLLAGYGIGYDLFIYANQKFNLVNDVTYLMFSLHLADSDLMDLWLNPIVLKTFHARGFGFVRCILNLNNALGVRGRDFQQVTVSSPLYKIKTFHKFSRKLINTSLDSEFYVLGFTGKTRSGKEEVWTEVISGDDAGRLRITKNEHSDTHDKINFTVPGDLMDKFLCNAFHSFSTR